MSSRTRSNLVLAALLLAGAVVFFTGDDWGLPNRDTDRYLFGAVDRAWSGADIAAKGGLWKPDPKRAADADSNPVARDRGRPVWLNATESQQAEIFARFRLYSFQPDEMVTFRALSGMRGGNFDPHMYQYGGLWIYPVGGLLRVASVLNWVTVKPDLSHYLDHPDDFGRFYVVARGYSGLWGLVGIWAVFRLATRLSDKLIVHAAAATCFLLMPVVINGAHEAKPHLAGAVLILLTALAATRYAETGERRWAWLAGALAGLATGMVLSAVVAFLILPLMTLLRPAAWGRRAGVAATAGLLGVVAYCVTNPYVPINLVRDPTVVRENLGALSKAKAIVGRSSEIGAVANAHRLIVDGASVVGGAFGLIGILIAVANRRWWGAHSKAKAVAILLGVPAAVVALQFVALAGGKMGEFGRFAILPDVALVLVGVTVAFSTRIARWWPGPMLATLALLTGLQGYSYLAGFWADGRQGKASRDVAAARLEELWNRGARTIGVRADPAPYCLPPIDFTRWKVLLMPEDFRAGDGEAWPDVMVFPVDDVEPSGEVAGTPYVRSTVLGNRPWGRARISWADKPFEIRTRRDLIEPGKP
jgi:hypothetical protein